MKKDAELHADEDKKKRELVEARNSADTLAYTAEKALKDAEGKITDDSKKAVEEKIIALKSVKDSNDVKAMSDASQALSSEMMKIGEAMNAQAKQNPEPPKEEGNNPESTIRDADVK